MKKYLCILFLVLFNTSVGWTLGNSSSVVTGNATNDVDQPDDAVGYFTAYVEQHPITPDSTSGEIRDTITAYSNLFKALKNENNSYLIVRWVQRLKNETEQADVDPKNLYRLGRIYYTYQFYEDAAQVFYNIVTRQKSEYSVDFLKAELRAYEKLVKICQIKGWGDQLKALTTDLKNRYPNIDFDFFDQHQLAAIYTKCGLNADAEKLLINIIAQDDHDLSSRYFKARIDSYIQLLMNAFQKKDDVAFKSYLDQMETHYPLDSLPAPEAYKLAMTLLKCDEGELGNQFLTRVSNQFPETIQGRKALFMLGKIAQRNQQWDAAIQLFSRYIQQHPQEPIFTRKAYSRMIDAYIAKGVNRDLIRRISSQLAGIVNDTEKFGSQWQLAATLKEQGLDELSRATYVMGVAKAKELIDFQEAISNWDRQDYDVAVENYREFANAYPESDQLDEALFRIGCSAQKKGHYTEAKAIFDTILSHQGKAESFDQRQFYSKTKQRLATLMVSRNDLPMAKKLFRELRAEGATWRDRTYAAHWLQRILSSEAYASTATEQFGGCCGVPNCEDDLGAPNDDDEGEEEEDPCAAYGAPVWKVNMSNLNFYMHDIPMWYNAPVGPSVKIDLSYNSQSAFSHNEAFGNKWQFNYASYLIIDISENVAVIMPDGRRDIFISDGAGGYSTLSLLQHPHQGFVQPF